MTPTPDITLCLDRWKNGDAQAAQLLPLVYQELRALARSHLRRERLDHTLQPTALVHHLFLGLAAQGQPTPRDTFSEWFVIDEARMDHLPHVLSNARNSVRNWPLPASTVPTPAAPGLGRQWSARGTICGTSR